MHPRTCQLIFSSSLSLLTLAACSGSDTGSPPGETGGAVGAVGGADGSSGGSTAVGTSSSSGGSVLNAGAGGVSATGGNSATTNVTTGGMPSTGGANAVGGATSTGGMKTTGGAPSTGGANAVGGAPSTGGMKATGGMPATGEATSTDCNTPPAPSTLVGWAAQSGNGTTTTTGGGTTTPVTVTTLAALQTAAKGTNAAVIYVKGVLAAGVVTVGSNKTIVGICGGEIHGHVEINGSVKLNITWHHDWWADNVYERQPQVRFGKNHLFNNLWTSSGNNYCYRAVIDAHAYFDHNVFSGVKDPHLFYTGANTTSNITADTTNTYTNTTGSRLTGGNGAAYTPSYAYTPDATAQVQSLVTNGAGPQ